MQRKGRVRMVDRWRVEEERNGVNEKKYKGVKWKERKG